VIIDIRILGLSIAHALVLTTINLVLKLKYLASLVPKIWRKTHKC